tara:strand:- start:456 stop:680 length:225 start_codon:yes stop_codon:yes gene_type:complete
MKTLRVVVTENCELCDKGIKKIGLLKYFFNIEEVSVEDGYQQYLLRVPVVLFKDSVLDEGILTKTKIIKNYIFI